MSIGVPFDVIMHTTLRDLSLYDEAHERKLKEDDYMNYIAGEYVFDALMVALGNMFSKKGTPIKSFTDVRKQPVLSEVIEHEEVVDEQTAYEKYRVQRMIDKLNWDLAKIYESKGE